jgi:hypothetical protein
MKTYDLFVFRFALVPMKLDCESCERGLRHFEFLTRDVTIELPSSRLIFHHQRASYKPANQITT